MPKSSKGSAFERDLCGQLSEWWCPGRDDIFWRTAGSGARAKVRGRAGKSTANSAGDISAIDPIGQPLIDLVTIEIKRGYSSDTLHDLLDKSKEDVLQEWEQWIAQAEESHRQANSLSWLIISKRDRRVPIVVMPYFLLSVLHRYGAFQLSLVVRCPFPVLQMRLPFYDDELVAMRLSMWFKGVTQSIVADVISHGG